MEPVLSLQSLHKNFGGLTAVSNLSLEVEKGWVYGLLGPNGSGKTTTLGMLLGVIHPSAGAYSWFGQPPGPEQLKSIGAILEAPLFYPYLSGEKNLKIVARIKNVPDTRVDEVLERVGLLPRKKSAFKTYSLGMKQRLAIAAALLPDPEVLILDEPTNGLDPEGIAQIRMLIQQIAKGGTTIILASHLLDEVEKVCSHVGILQRGNLRFHGPVSEVAGGTQQIFEVVTADNAGLAAVAGEWLQLKQVKNEGDRVLLFPAQPITGADVNRWCFEKGIVLSHIKERKTSLEQQFLQLLGKRR